MYQSSLLLIFPAAMAFAAAMDMLTMTIPNRISLGLLAAFLLIFPIAGLPLDVVASHLAAGGIMLVAGVVMFAFGWVGGGDAKLLAAGALWLGLPQLAPFLLVTAMFGSVLLLALVAYRGYPAAALPIPEWAVRLHRSETGMPYGLAIGAAALVLFPYSALFKALI
ncbi:MAG: prepilin peptidase [Hyphomicrobiaceae bacterium]|nr:prepilin peptidase [Hyphomicrobiaceae bacterium]